MTFSLILLGILIILEFWRMYVTNVPFSFYFRYRWEGWFAYIILVVAQNTEYLDAAWVYAFMVSRYEKTRTEIERAYQEESK